VGELVGVSGAWGHGVLLGRAAAIDWGAIGRGSEVRER
jgi:hypothetical protein